MIPEHASDSRMVLEAAAAKVGLDATTATVIRLGENHIYRLPGGVVARVARVGQHAAATNEVRIARWLEDGEVPAARVLHEVEQPVVVDGRPVTFWQELPPHEPGTGIDVATVLRRFHALSPPNNFELPRLDPFVRIAERIRSASTLSNDDQRWMLTRLAEVRDAYGTLPPGLPRRVVHGDAWEGNVVRTHEGGLVLLDFERCSLGPPEWDLVSTAVSHVTTGWIDSTKWTAYSNAYGFDVTTWHGFDILRDIRELRMTSMAAQVAATNPAQYADQAAHRLACLQGQRGPRPWSGWQPVP
ncbi:aminoglycoside phosphotransferase [Saccharothrix sp. NRRL B-16348]|uniref:phosphotransferase enzyme family protein n=1 Tax=Saccharothrix sp. NRRL B-16348 TaxID=1415542 RepID=UPI0006AF2F76|nr:aminoglycoside phosphotransferase family protein [Saccharothrix sp. NRRL B-16348]KOX19802.1 aminoglycoside phosphotransferase [Saccharothrix sp. NRRL B-16348]